MPAVTLLPCPFCGSGNVGFGRIGRFPGFVECRRCGCRGPVVPVAGELDAVGFLIVGKAWNRRRVTRVRRSRRRTSSGG